MFSTLPHFDRLRSATVTGSVLEGYALADVLEQISVLAEEVLPVGGGYRFTFSGESEDFFESRRVGNSSPVFGVVSDNKQL